LCAEAFFLYLYHLSKSLALTPNALASFEIVRSVGLVLPFSILLTKDLSTPRALAIPV